MSDRSKKKNVEHEASAAAQAATVDNDQQPASPAEPTIESLQAELAELRDKNLRLMAELRNVQQRAEREKREALRYAEADFTKALLPIVDDLERTLESARQKHDVEAVTEGVRIVYDHLMKILKSRHIEPIAAEGQAFDPDVHEAMLQQPSDEVAAGHVLKELARGYKMHERVLRSAKVIVSSGSAASEDGAQE